ncbi:MAG: hypothetical protein WCH99_04350 [Verrucomicrobiota bacterium]
MRALLKNPLAYEDLKRGILDHFPNKVLTGGDLCSEIAQVEREGFISLSGTRWTLTAPGIIRALKFPKVEIKPIEPMPTVALCSRIQRHGEMKHTCLIDDIGISAEELENVNLAQTQMRDRGEGNFIAEAIREKLSRNSSIIACAANELNEAVVQSNVLLELIENHLDYRANRGGEDFTGRRADTFNHGLALLAQNTRQRLAEASEAMTAAASPKKSEGAS